MANRPNGLSLVPPPRRATRPRAELWALVALLVPLAYLGFATWEDHSFVTDGQATIGQVKRVSGMIYNGIGYSYEISYAYSGMPASMKRATTSPASIGRSPVYEKLAPGSIIKVTYLKSDPASSRIGEPRDFTFASHFRNRELLPMLAGLWTLIALGAYAEAVIRGRRDYNLLVHGTAISGKVTKLEVSQMKGPYTTTEMYYVTYAFAGPDGNEVSQRRQVKKAVFARLKEGQSVVVLQDPSNPKRFGAYPLLRARLTSQQEHEAALACDEPEVETVVPPQPEVAEPAAVESDEQVEAPEITAEQWKEEIIVGYQNELGMTREQVLRYLARRPYPNSIRLAGLIVAAVVVLAIAQSPKYLRLSVDLERARIMAKQGRYEETIATLERASKAGLKCRKASYLLGKTYFMIGDFDGTEKWLDTLEPSDAENEQLDAIEDQITTAAPYLKGIQESIKRRDAAYAVPRLEKAVAAWPTGQYANYTLASAYAALFIKTLDDSYATKYQERMTALRHMFPSLARSLDREYGDLPKYKAASVLSEQALKLLDEKKTDKAITALKQSLDVYPTQSKAHAYLAIAYAQKYEATKDKQFKDLCLKEYKTAVKLNPTRKNVKPKLGSLAGEVD